VTSSWSFIRQLFMRIRLVEAEQVHADVRANRKTGRHDEANSRFSKFCEYA